jgi:UDP-N-acetylmuramate--L-alanine ligase
MENKPDLAKILENRECKLYFVGIGGIAMSATACLAKEAGFEVEGSDSKEIYSPAKDVIDDAKLNYHVGYNLNQVKNSKADLFILSAGEGLENPEVKYILDNNLPYVGFAELLFELSKASLRIVVTGTHGKSTTAGLLGSVLKGLDDSSYLTGGVLQNTGNNFYLGNGHYFVFEGDEYKNLFNDPTPKFHFYKPDILVLTNLEYDHPDLFTSFEDLKTEFEQLIANLPPDGLLVYNADDANLVKLAQTTEVASVSFGIENQADFKIEKISYDSDYTTFEVFNQFSKNISSKLLNQTEQYKIQLPGKLNAYNALAVIATLRALGFQPADIQLDLLAYRGIKRRFEVVGMKNQITVIDDYAHHPTAVRETLLATKLKYPKQKVWAIFEPHTFSRTKATLNDLAKSFDTADEVLIAEIYPAREKVVDANISSKEVIDAIINQQSANSNQQTVRGVKNKQEALEILKKELVSGDVVVVMAVGNFNQLAYELISVI